MPICVSTTSGKINLNRWNNGHAIVEMLEPVDISGYGRENVRELAAHCHELMLAKIAELDAEVAQRNAAGK
ncbi:1-acyl-sn-glycerol-3-phosphate acyltransferase [compost metagenome]